MIIEKYPILWKHAYMEVSIGKWNLLFKQSQGVEQVKAPGKGKKKANPWMLPGSPPLLEDLSSGI